MIDATESVFPYNAVKVIADRMRTIDSDLYVTTRPLRSSDPNQSIGVFGQQWLPDEESLEMRGLPVAIHEPTLSQYLIGIQGFIKDMEEERGAVVHGVLSKRIRTMLYRDSDLRVALHSLSVQAGGSIERTQRFGVRTTRYLSNELSGSWLYLSTIEFWLETETA